MLRTRILEMRFDNGARSRYRPHYKITFMSSQKDFPDDDVIKQIWKNTEKSYSDLAVTGRNQPNRILFISLPQDTSETLRQRFLQNLENVILGNTK